MTGLPGIAALRCASCGSADVAVFGPGAEGEAARVGDLFVPTCRGEPTRAWCLSCAIVVGWPWPSELPRQRRRKSTA